MIAISLVLIAFMIIWYYDTKEDKDIEDAINDLDERDDSYNY